MRESRRPEAEAVLAAMQPEHRGRLRIFLGAAAGVGKTYAMLAAARQRQAEGVEVVVGLVETHGRAETELLLEGLEVLPRRAVSYHEHTFGELDLDGLLARRPRLALVDELAHSNVAGSRHGKRYADVEELLEAGIDVYTTVNIQHLESLNDVVAQITGVRVRETVPDRVFERADEIELVDLSPDDLLSRLAEGKVYVPQMAEQARARFFRPGNLAALRELALRQAAQRAGGQVRSYMALHGIDGPWPTEERLLVCVSPSPLSPRLVRAARRMADSRQCPWLAVYVETPRHVHLPDADRDRAAATLRMAEELGAQVLTVTGERVVDALVDVARRHNVTEIVVGKPERPPWRELLGGSIMLDLIHKCGDIAVFVVTAKEEAAEPQRARPPRAAPAAETWAGVLLSVLAAGLLAAWLRELVTLPNLSMIFLLPVLLAAVRWGLVPAITAAVLSLLIYDVFFVVPYYTLTVAQPQDLLALIMFLVVAVLTSDLTARLRAQVAAAKRRETATAALYSLSRDIAAAQGLESVAEAVATRLHELLEAGVVVLVRENEALAVRAACPAELVLTEAERAAAAWAWQHDREAGWSTDTLPGIAWLCLPLRTARSRLGVLALKPDSPALPLPDQRRLWSALATQAALAIERALLAQIETRAQALSEADRLKTALLSMVSHDFRSPLASIQAAASSLRQDAAPVSAEDQDELLSVITGETERLNHVIENILALSRLESGGWRPQVEPTPVAELIGAALESVGRRNNARVTVRLAPEVDEVEADPVQWVAVLHNLIENALKYSAEPAPVELVVSAAGDRVRFEVRDRGPGLPTGDEARVFEPFYRGPAMRESATPGVGMGLAICRGLVEAHGGTVVALPRPGGGTVFRAELPRTAGEPSG